MVAGGVRLLRTRDVSSTVTTRAIGMALIALWLAGVVLITLNHEYWRDEVRAWSLSRRATSPFELHALVRYEGHPLLWYLLPFLLANTNVHSALLAGVLSALWFWEGVRFAGSAARERWAAFLGSGFIVALGMAMSVAVIWPPQDSVLVSRAVVVPKLLSAALSVAVQPGKAFGELTPAFVPSWLTSVLLLSAIAGLTRQPRFALTGFVAMVALGTLFAGVYPGSFRHQGLVLILLVVLYWLALDDTRETAPEPRHLLRSVGLNGAMVALYLAALVQTRYFASQDLRRPMSSAKTLAEFLIHSPYRDAIIVAEPDYYAEALPYYASNRIYFPRERRFGTTVMWTTAVQERLTLSELIDAAKQVAERERQQVLILLGHREIHTKPSGTTRFPYEKEFMWTEGDRRQLAAATRLVADFASAAGDENYSVHALLPAVAHDSVVGTPARAPLSPPRQH